MKDLPKAYEPFSIENKWYQIWQNNKIYKSSALSNKKKYSILMPPPNVTGILHFGHVLNITLQDIYIRWKRMKGYEVCWFPGYDHAGIATQTKVEKELAKQNLTRFDLGREEFLKRVWEWKEKYGGIILKQLRYLGISCDWDRTLFTLDESASNAVRETFIRLFDEGLIYKGKKIINWSPLLQTALSDEEVEPREVKEHLFTLKYYFEDYSSYLSVATVRPETIFGDVAVAVNPKDDRYTHLIGKKVIVPLANRLVDIIPDDYADPTFGTGCVKITPAHDPNDFEVGLRHNLQILNSINPDGTLNELAAEFNGMERFTARKAILEKLKEYDLIEKIEDYTHNVGYSQRSGEPVEPYLSEQWFVKMKPLAEIALKPVLDGRIKFYPNHWVKTYEHWLNNVRDWCISRQLWWGHRIPVYYAEDGRYTAASNREQARKKLNLPENAPLWQEEDVLDTWFSSWLWPLTTMHWLADGKIENTPELDAFLPTDLLVTAPDIIFFWVARMIMATMKFKNEIPFKDVYFTSTIRDSQNRKLSKTLGNSPDPIYIISQYGSDAVRFTSIFLSPLGQDVRLDIYTDEKTKKQDILSMEIGRNFANKIWNACRFLLMKSKLASINEVCPCNENKILTFEDMSIADRWILSRFHSTINNIDFLLNNYKVNDYSKLLYDFIWRDFCDWYLEIIKIQLNNREGSYQQALMRFALSIYEGIIKLLHPVMPFITEEIYHNLFDISQDESISLKEFPIYEPSFVNIDLEENFTFFQQIIEEIRSLRASSNIPPQKKLPILISAKNPDLLNFIKIQSDIIKTLANASELKIDDHIDKPHKALSSVIREVEIFVNFGEELNIKKEIERINKEIIRLETNINASEKKLSNEGFLNKANPEIVNFEKEKLESMKISLKKNRENLEHLLNIN